MFSTHSLRQCTVAAVLAAILIITNGWIASPVSQNPGTSSPGQETERFDYRVLATKKTSTMEKELNEAADAGYRYCAVMGGETAWGGSEVVVVMGKDADSELQPRYEYKLLATNKTSTMQKELQEAADAGFKYRGQTVFSSMLGGKEVVVIMEHDREEGSKFVEYKLLGTNKTSTMQNELREVGEQGFEFVGLTVAKTAFGGSELVTILQRVRH